MIRRFLIALLAVSMSAHLSGCSSSDAKDDTSVAESNDETFAEEGEGDFADEGSTQTAESTDTSTESTDLAEGGGDSVASSDSTTDAKPEDGADDLALDDGPAKTSTAENSETSTTTETTETAATDQAAKPEDDLSLDDPGALPEDVATANPPVENITDNPTTPSDAGVFEEPKASQEVASAPPPEPAIDNASNDVASNLGSSDSASSNSTPSETASSDYSAPAKPVVFAPLLKVKESAFTAANGTTLNRVYLARPKDTAKSVSQKLYGETSRSKDLVKWNPVLKRGVRVGDKIYYTSATNPSDGRMMNHYEEVGLAPQTYVSKDGDNLRTVSKDLLGFKDAWKEVWATNASVESKGKIPAGLEIRYWPETGASAPVQTLASTTTPPVDPANSLPSTLPDVAPSAPVAQGMNEVPPNDPFANAPPNQGQMPGQMPGQAVADNGAGPDPLAPPPPIDMAPGGAGTVGTDPMAPPPAEPAAATPPPAPKPAKKVAAATIEEDPMTDDTTMALGVGGVLLVAAAVLFVLIRKNRAKRMDLGQTQV